MLDILATETKTQEKLLEVIDICITLTVVDDNRSVYICSNSQSYIHCV